MISCKQCQTPNSLDSTFCKRCGASIAETEIAEARGRMEKLVEEGNALFNQGRTDEALAIADSVVLADPGSISAWSLKTLCHERRGEIAEALECADKLVELNPESDFDRIRRSTLRQKLQTDLHVPATPDRRLAVIGSISAVVLVLCVGAIVARMNANNAVASRTDNHPISNPAPSLTNNPQVVQQPAPTNQVQQPAQTPSNPVSSPNQGNDSNNGGFVDNRRPADTGAGRIPSYGGSSLPEVGDLGSGLEVQPLQVPTTGLTVNSNPNPAATGPKTIKNQEPAADNGTDPTVEKTGDSTTTPPKSNKPEDNGVFITVHGGQNTKGPGSGGAEPIGTTGLAALTRVATEQFQLGNYAAAAKSYEQAVHSGGDPILLNMRLGQSYQSLGRSSDAADAYTKCISAIDAALAAGRGDKDRLSSARGVCEQSLKVLKGG